MGDPTDPEGLPVWPAAERNRDPILKELIRLLAGVRGTLLEIASGTGQHAEHFAPALPNLHYVPSDVDPIHLETLRRRVARARHNNLAPPIELDVHEPRWPVARVDVIYCANMIHIAPWQACVGLMKLAGHALLPGGVLITYGPYRIAGQHTAPSNERFDEWLAAKDRRYGVRDLEAVTDVAQAAGLRYRERIAMPANNFCLLFEREASSG